MRTEVSVIVPVYNAEKYIAKCAKSLFEQTLQNIQYIFINDCSTDRSMKILTETINEYPEKKENIIIIHHEENRGISYTRNTGLQYAEGEYIGWTDADDWIETGMFKSLYESAVKEKADLVWSDFYTVFSDEVKVKKQNSPPDKLQLIQSMLSGNFHGAMWNKLIKRSLYEKNKIEFPSGINILEDKLTLLKLTYYSQRLVYLPQPLYYYNRENVHSITSNSDIQYLVHKKAESTNLMIEFLQKRFENVESWESVRLAKFIAKKQLLMSSNIQDFRQWGSIYPEINKYSYYKKVFPLHKRLLAWFSQKRWFLPVHVWALTKKLRGV